MDTVTRIEAKAAWTRIVSQKMRERLKAYGQQQRRKGAAAAVSRATAPVYRIDCMASPGRP
jgi:hypothetical protein